jgi:acyl-coenzyme A synthetase/AMP-(fatty) acid ligase
LARCAAWSGTSAPTGPANRLATLPLIAHSSADAVIAYRGGQPLLVRQFLADVARLTPTLGRGAHVLNACADRYHFAVGLAACLVADKVSLLPSTHTPEVMRQLRHFAADVVCLTDDPQCDIELPRVRYPLDAEPAAPAAGAVPHIDSARRVAYVFTSGSTGTPVAHAKTWGRLTACVREEASRLALGGNACAIIATVPPQHMYGFESSLLLALLNGHALCAERPFYPADIAAALARVPRPRVLVSTPVHLRALVGSGVALPPTDLIVCSTAPLSQQLALEVEERCHTRLLEIYGSTETGEIAARRPTASPEWRLWPGVTLTVHEEETWAQGGHIEEPTRLCDVLELTGPDTFLLHGRVADLVNIAGKRSSLGYLNHQLNSIPGVLDGAFFHADEPHGTAVARVGACVVAPGLDPETLVAQLRQRIDPAFLPRPLLMVPRLPRNSTGKLPQAALRSLAASNPKSIAAG